MTRSIRYPLVALGVVALYAIANAVLAGHPVALSIFGNLALIAAAASVVAAVWWRRPSRAGCQRLFWDTFAIGMALWIVGHLGWAYDDLVHGRQAWLRWHTVFSLCGGIAPLIALLARPHRGVRQYAVGTLGVDIAALGLLTLFIFSYFVLVPSLVPGGESHARSTLFLLIHANRILLLLGLVLAARAAWKTDWRTAYLMLAFGTAIGFLLRVGTSVAISRGDYYVGGVYDFAWTVPWLIYAAVAAEAPASPAPDPLQELPEQPTGMVSSVAPLLLIPAVGYGMLFVVPLEPTIDSFRALLTSVCTVGGLALLTFRLAVQRGALQRTDARLRLLGAAAEQTADLILITCANGRFQYANEAFVRALGYPRGELADKRHEDLLAGDVSHLSMEIPQAIRDHGIWRGTLLRRRKNGSTFPSACTVSALRIGGTIRHYVGVERDISEELRLRDQLVHSERLSAIGELVAGVAHELNNPLQTIVGTVELMLDERPGAPAHSDLELVRREAARAGHIVRSLLTFVRRGSSNRTITDLTELVRSTVSLREYHLRQQNIDVVTHYAPEPLQVFVNTDEIRQVVLNLLLNAEHAISTAAESGTITVATSVDGLFHALEVVDSGPGVSPDIRGRIFEPFFTTKDVGEGTGLGLSISHGVASAHGGSLELRHSDTGARFRLSLPPHHAEHPSGLEAAAPAATPEPRRVLIVDDEAPIRQLLVRLLERRGFDVEQVETGEEASSLTLERDYDVVLCDVRMPGIDGLELYRLVTSKSPEMAGCFIFMTGDAAGVGPLGPVAAQAAVLPKPFTAADLDAVLTRVVNTAQVRRRSGGV